MLLTNGSYQDVSQEDFLTKLLPAIDRIEEAVLSSQPLPDALNLILETALNLLDAPYGSLRLVNLQTKKLVSKARLRAYPNR